MLTSLCVLIHKLSSFIFDSFETEEILIFEKKMIKEIKLSNSKTSFP